MKKLYRKLTENQKKGGVIFSSSLSIDKNEGSVIHEVLQTDDDKDIKMERLTDDSFFNGSHFKYNIIRN